MAKSRDEIHIELRPTVPEDLPLFFQMEKDPVAVHMAAFTAKDPADEAAFMVHWERIMNDPSTRTQTILVDGQIAGNVASFIMFGGRNVSYWLRRDFWGQGIATRALGAFLAGETTRPLYGRVVHDNIGSRRVLEKCGFTLHGQDRGFAHGRGAEVDEFIFILEGSNP